MVGSPDFTGADDAPFVLARREGDRVVVRGRVAWASAPPGRAAMLRGQWAWRDGVLSAQVDRYGFFNLFVYEKDGVIALSPSLLQLVAEGCDATPDRRALAVFHRLGIFVGDDTPLAHVRVLPPGGQLHWDGSGPARITGGQIVQQEQRIDRDSAVEGLIEHFRTAVSRALAECPGPFHVPLSGGRDSRHILLEVLHQGRRPAACVTFHHNGVRLNREAQAARALCERLGVAHDVLGYARPRIADIFRALAMTGLCADEHAQMMPLHDYFLGREGASFDGIAGDILTNPDDSADRYMQLARKGDYKAIADDMIAGHGRVISTRRWGRGAGAIWSPGMDEAARDHVAAAIARYDAAPDPYQMFWMFHRTRREISFVPQAILGSAERVFCPYLDPDFAEFCLSLPYAVTRDQQLHNDAIARAYPAVADIPYQEGFAEVPARRAPLGTRMSNLRDLSAIAAALAPGRGVRLAWQALARSRQLKRPHSEIYALHALCMEGLDAERARRILTHAALLKARRPWGLISDRLKGK